jgi:hypothetical protein
VQAKKQNVPKAVGGGSLHMPSSFDGGGGGVAAAGGSDGVGVQPMEMTTSNAVPYLETMDGAPPRWRDES